MKREQLLRYFEEILECGDPENLWSTEEHVQQAEQMARRVDAYVAAERDKTQTAQDQVRKLVERLDAASDASMATSKEKPLDSDYWHGHAEGLTFAAGVLREAVGVGASDG